LASWLRSWPELAERLRPLWLAAGPGAIGGRIRPGGELRRLLLDGAAELPLELDRALG
jgi:hypothetical protein